jgi:decaprenylphospho-beta-D-ribofuranose 2-oxidase
MRNPSWSFPNRTFRIQQKTVSIADNVSIAIGGEQSYGDANFYHSGKSVRLDSRDIQFNSDTNILEASGSVTLKEVLNYLLIYSKTLIVVPGTPNATIAGCVASDIHGKNSFKVGSFSSSVIEIMLNGSRGDHWIDRRDELAWKSTIGGQGLSGVIKKVRLSTAPLKSTRLYSERFLTKGIEDNFLRLIELSKDHEFAVSWIDSHGIGSDNYGFVEVADSLEKTEKLIPIKNFDLIPRIFPRLKLINRFSIYLYTLLIRLTTMNSGNKKRYISRWSFLFPNINFGKWNRLFGKNGFHEIQFLCDVKDLKIAAEMVQKICREKDVFLIGTKLLNQEPDGFLSFPGKGLSIAVNFAADNQSQAYVELIYSELISKLSSRVYLTKDWVLTPELFKIMYPEYTLLKGFRELNGLKHHIKSSFSERVQLDF